MTLRAIYAVISVQLILLGSFVYLNYAKIGYAVSQYRALSMGEPPPDVEIVLEGNTVIHRRLPSTGLFDATGAYQIDFLMLPGEKYDLLKTDAGKVQLRVDNQYAVYQINVYNKTIHLSFGDRKLILLRGNDMESLARTLQAENKYRRDAISCSGKALCKQIRISVAGLAGLGGPYLKSEENNLFRGLPKGRWGLGPAIKLKITSNITSTITIILDMLSPFKDQQISLEGPASEITDLDTRRYDAPYGAPVFYPLSKKVRTTLQPGDNEIVIRFSRWRHPGPQNRLPLAAYITGIKMLHDQSG